MKLGIEALQSLSDTRFLSLAKVDGSGGLALNRVCIFELSLLGFESCQLAVCQRKVVEFPNLIAQELFAVCGFTMGGAQGFELLIDVTPCASGYLRCFRIF